jgi:flagellar biosynthesis chaperone FliJ
MKAFEFRLERILEFRKEQAELERGRLHEVMQQIRRLEAEATALATRSNDEHDRVIAGEEVTGRDLASLSNYRQHVRRLSKELSRAQQVLDAHMQRQKAVVMESERKVRLLQRLKDKRHTAWQSACDRELEELAADSYLARLAAMRRSENQAEPVVVE